jgi:predicted aldo/keto reductase-like oxidoreductase
VADKLSIGMIDKAEDMQSVFDGQIERSGLDYFDIYLLHALGKDYYAKAKDFKAFEFAAQKKAEGKVKHVGFSFHDSAEVLDMILTEHPEVEYVQLQINYLDWEDENVQSRKCYEVAMKHNKMVAIMEPIKGGSLANIMDDAKKLFTDYNPNASVASWAVRYAASLDNILVVLSGMSNMEQLNDNMSYMKDFVPLSAEEQDVVAKATDLIKSTIAIPCTACRYCTDGCPQKINIPRMFELYNESKRYGVASFKWHYNEELKKSGNPADCIECHLCESNCPQKLQIVDLLKEVAKTFE